LWIASVVLRYPLRLPVLAVRKEPKWRVQRETTESQRKQTRVWATSPFQMNVFILTEISESNVT